VAEVSGFESVISLMTQADAFTLLLPFLLSYLVFKFALDNVSLFNDTDFGNMSPVIALILAFFTARFIVVNPFYQSFFVDFFGKLIIGIVGILGFGVLLAFSGYDLDGTNLPIMAVIMSAIVGAAFLTAGGFGPAWVEASVAYAYARQAAVWTLESGAIWLLVIVGVLAFTAGGDDGGDSPSILRALFDGEYATRTLLGDEDPEDY